MNKETLERLYTEEGKSLREIGLICSVSTKTVWNYCKKFNIPIRPFTTKGLKVWFGKKHSEESKSKMAKIKTGKKSPQKGTRRPNLQGEKNGMFGRKGVLSPSYKGAIISDASRIRSTAKMHRLSQDVKKRDGSSCVACGSNKNLHMHHIIPIAKNPDLAYNEDNCVTLCPVCHSLAHKILDAVA